MPKNYSRLGRIEKRLSICRPEKQCTIVTTSYFDESPFFADEEEKQLFISWRCSNFTDDDYDMSPYSIYHYRQADVEKHLQTFKALKEGNLLSNSTACTPAIYLPPLNGEVM